MSPKAILVFCAQALLAQSAFSACAGSYNGLAGGCGSGLGGGYGIGLARGCGAGIAGGYGAGFAGGYGAGCGSAAAGVASTGGGLPVSSASPIAPVGVTVLSENAYEGTLTAGGNLPFLGGVAIEGVLPSGGTGAVSYGCGDGAIGVGSEGPIYTGMATPGAMFPPTSPSAAATNAVMVLGNGLGGGYGNGGAAGYGIGGAAGYGIGGAGCGFGGISSYGQAARGCGCGY